MTNANTDQTVKNIDVMGPKILVVPVSLGLAYVGMAYLSWTLARLILEETQRPLAGSRVMTVALLASAIGGRFLRDLGRRKPPSADSPAGTCCGSDPSGVRWKVSSITAASAAATISTMGAFALLAWIRRPGAGRGRKATRQSGLGAEEIALG
jgi:hypothetical protein